MIRFALPLPVMMFAVVLPVPFAVVPRSVRFSTLAPSVKLALALTRSVPCPDDLDRLVTGIVDDIGVVLRAAAHRVDSGAAVERVVAVVPLQRIVVVAAEQKVVAADAEESVVAVETVEPVGAVVAGDDIGAAVAAAAHRGPRQSEPLDIVDQAVGDAAQDEVVALVHVLHGKIAQFIDDVGVVAAAAAHRVDAAAAVQRVGAALAEQRVAAAETVDRRAINAAGDDVGQSIAADGRLAGVVDRTENVGVWARPCWNR